MRTGEPNTPQSPPRDIPTMPEPDRPRVAAEGEELHWPDLPINEVPEDELAVLLKQAGPVGEQARLAWESYKANNPDVEDPAAIERERQRLAELGQTPPEDEASAPEASTADAEAMDAATTSTSPMSRAEAEQRAGALGLEVRDFGTAGDWRLYDKATGRQVAKSRLEEAP